ncbi:MAG: hypothetical protein VX335_04355, partial [Pseudomonadota bacterium]|nr:hypothetical protein [Pseudomonadota bacterium]
MGYCIDDNNEEIKNFNDKDGVLDQSGEVVSKALTFLTGLVIVPVGIIADVATRAFDKSRYSDFAYDNPFTEGVLRFIAAAVTSPVTFPAILISSGSVLFGLTNASHVRAVDASLGFLGVSKPSGTFVDPENCRFGELRNPTTVQQGWSGLCKAIGTLTIILPAIMVVKFLVNQAKDNAPKGPQFKDNGPKITPRSLKAHNENHGLNAGGKNSRSPTASLSSDGSDS